MNAHTQRSTATSVLAGAILCAALAATLILGSAVFVIATGRSAEVRRAFGFGFAGVERSPDEVVWIAMHNARVAGATLACAVAAPRLPRRMRRIVDAVLACVLSISTGAVGAAYAAYRWRAIAATAPHLPVEFAGLSLAGGAYLHARIQAIPARDLTAIAAACALLLTAAALLETYVSPGGS
jgi:hypothetical protein